MGEVDMIRLFVKPSPRDLFSLFLKSPDLFFFWGFGDRFFIAFEADV
jgi:hypothetical protein